MSEAAVVPRRVVGPDSKPVDLMATLVEHGMLLESAHGPLPNVAELVTGEPITGSWWAHPSSHAIFDAINALAASPDVVRLRLVRGKVTLVHRRVWCALVRVADRFPIDSLAAIREEHTASGAHRAVKLDFPEWVPPDVLRHADELSEEAALAELPACLRPLTDESTGRRGSSSGANRTGRRRRSP